MRQGDIWLPSLFLKEVIILHFEEDYVLGDFGYDCHVVYEVHVADWGGRGVVYFGWLNVAMACGSTSL